MLESQPKGEAPSPTEAEALLGLKAGGVFAVIIARAGVKSSTLAGLTEDFTRNARVIKRICEVSELPTHDIVTVPWLGGTSYDSAHDKLSPAARMAAASTLCRQIMPTGGEYRPRQLVIPRKSFFEAGYRGGKALTRFAADLVYNGRMVEVGLAAQQHRPYAGALVVVVGPGRDSLGCGLELVLSSERPTQVPNSWLVDEGDELFNVRPRDSVRVIDACWDDSEFREQVPMGRGGGSVGGPLGDTDLCSLVFQSLPPALPIAA